MMRKAESQRVVIMEPIEVIKFLKVKSRMIRNVGFFTSKATNESDCFRRRLSTRAAILEKT